MDMARLNFSHGSHDDHKRLIGLVREESAAAGRVVPILQDLQGPKIRIGEMKNGGVLLHKGQSLYLTAEPVEYGTRKRVHVSYPSLASAVEIGGSILVDDGNIELSVMEVNGAEVKTEVVVGGVLRSRKGVNLPQIRSSSPSLTEKDRIDLQFGLENDVDFIGLSFVRSAEDVRELIGKVRESGKSVGVIAKIEKPEAVEDFKNILACSDAVMLSGETAVGKYPVRTVEVMDEIIRSVEGQWRGLGGQEAVNVGGASGELVTQAISFTAVQLAEDVEAKALCCLTHSGATARAIARHRPEVPIYAFTDNTRIVRRLALLWGTDAFAIPFQSYTDDGISAVHLGLLRRGLAEPGDRVVITAGLPLPAKGLTNMVHVSTIGEERD